MTFNSKVELVPTFTNVKLALDVHLIMKKRRTYYGRLYNMKPMVVSTICAAAQYITNEGVTFIFILWIFLFFLVTLTPYTTSSRLVNTKLYLLNEHKT